MSAKLIHNPRCSKSRQAIALLEKNNINFDVIDYLKNPLSLEQLDEVCKKLDMAPEEVVRKKESIFTELGLKDRKLSRQEWLSIIEKNPKLLERPIFMNGNKAIVGRPPEDILNIIKV